MDASTIFTTILALVLIFLFAIQKFSHQMQHVAGKRLKSFLTRWSDNPIKGSFSGMLVTALLQSSTATSIILVGLVNAEIIPATNALSVVIGANVGGSITAQLVALKMTYIAPLVVIAGFILSHTHSRFKRYGKPIFYFGVIFFSLFIIGILAEPLKNHASFLAIIQSISNPFTALLAGALITFLFQSSSVLTGLVLILAGSGLIELPTAIGFMLGGNIGSPITALIASASASLEAKRVAIAHALFNYVGTLIYLPLITPFILLLQFISPDPVQQIVNAHFIFNASCAIVCLVFFKRFDSLARKVTSALYTK